MCWSDLLLPREQSPRAARKRESDTFSPQTDLTVADLWPLPPASCPPPDPSHPVLLLAKPPLRPRADGIFVGGCFLHSRVCMSVFHLHPPRPVARLPTVTHGALLVNEAVLQDKAQIKVTRSSAGAPTFACTPINLHIHVL